MFVQISGPMLHTCVHMHLKIKKSEIVYFKNSEAVIV